MSRPQESVPCLYEPQKFKVARFLCSIGGEIVWSGSRRCYEYSGGDTRLLNLSRDINFSELESRLSGIYQTASTLKYQLPGYDLDTLISVSDDSGFDEMMEEYDTAERSGQRFRLFLFPTGNPVVWGERAMEDSPGLRKEITELHAQVAEAMRRLNVQEESITSLQKQLRAAAVQLMTMDAPEAQGEKRTEEETKQASQELVAHHRQTLATPTRAAGDHGSFDHPTIHSLWGNSQRIAIDGKHIRPAELDRQQPVGWSYDDFKGYSCSPSPVRTHPRTLGFTPYASGSPHARSASSTSPQLSRRSSRAPSWDWPDSPSGTSPNHGSSPNRIDDPSSPGNSGPIISRTPSNDLRGFLDQSSHPADMGEGRHSSLAIDSWSAAQTTGSAASYIRPTERNWSQRWKYDIFISHAGEDKSFASHLHGAFEKLRLQAFLDEANLHGGDMASVTMLSAVQQAPVGLVLMGSAFFSKPWPMKELQEIVGQETLLPVLYKLTYEEVERFLATSSGSGVSDPAMWSTFVERVLRTTMVSDPSTSRSEAPFMQLIVFSAVRKLVKNACPVMATRCHDRVWADRVFGKVEKACTIMKKEFRKLSSEQVDEVDMWAQQMKDLRKQL